jgi:signal peptidase II
VTRAVPRIPWIWFVLAVLAVDQLTKFAVERFTALGSLRVVIPGLFNLVHTNNPGFAFGLLADSESPWMTSLLIAFSTAVMVFLVWLLVTGHAGARLGQTGMALILGGAAGNVMDRLLRRSVTDFIDLHLRGHHWYTFNVADSAIVIGAGMVLLELIRDWSHPTEEKA